MAEILCYTYIFHLTWLLAPHYLVKGRFSKFLPNTGFVTIRLLRFGVKVKTAYCRDNFLAQRPLPDMHRLSTDDFLMFQQDSTLAHWARDTITFRERERDARNVLSMSLCPCTRGTFQARILTIFRQSVTTSNNSAKSIFQLTVC